MAAGAMQSELDRLEDLTKQNRSNLVNFDSLNEDEKLTYLTERVAPALVAAQATQQRYHKEIQRSAKNHKALLLETDKIQKDIAKLRSVNTPSNQDAIRTARQALQEIRAQYDTLLSIPANNSGLVEFEPSPEVAQYFQEFLGPREENRLYDLEDIRVAMDGLASKISSQERTTSLANEKADKAALELQQLKKDKDDVLKSNSELHAASISMLESKIEQKERDIEKFEQDKKQSGLTITQLTSDSEELSNLRTMYDELINQKEELAEQKKASDAAFVGLKASSSALDIGLSELQTKVRETEEKLQRSSEAEIATASMLEEEQERVRQADVALEKASQQAEERRFELQLAKNTAERAQRDLEARLIKEKHTYGDSLKAVLTASITGESIPVPILKSVLAEDFPLMAPETVFIVNPGVTRNRLVPGGVVDVDILDLEITNTGLLRILRDTDTDLKANSLNFLLWMDQNLVERLFEATAITSEVYLAFAMLQKVLDDSETGWLARCMALAMLSDISGLFKFVDTAAWSGMVSAIVSSHPKLETLGTTCLVYLISTTEDPKAMQQEHGLHGSFDGVSTLIGTARRLAGGTSCMAFSQDNKEFVLFRSDAEEIVFTRRQGAGWVGSERRLTFSCPVGGVYVMSFGDGIDQSISLRESSESDTQLHVFFDSRHHSELIAAKAARLEIDTKERTTKLTANEKELDAMMDDL